MNKRNHAERAWNLWLLILDVEALLWEIYGEHFQEFMFPENQNDPFLQPEPFENLDPFS